MKLYKINNNKCQSGERVLQLATWRPAHKIAACECGGDLESTEAPAAGEPGSCVRARALGRLVCPAAYCTLAGPTNVRYAEARPATT